jgi:hypothetical protein
MRRLLIPALSLVVLALSAPPASAEWVWPIRGEVITPYRNGTDPYASGQHRGIDIAGEVGAPVVAATGGEVRFAGTAGSSGLTVSIRTADGRYDISYLHLGSTAVREGDPVGAGQRIGTVGTSGTRSTTAPHLHFGVRDAGTRHAYHDPLGFLPPPPGSPEPPRATPAPHAAPAPAGPAPAPVHSPIGHPAPAPRGMPLGAATPRRLPARTPKPRPRPAAAPDADRVPVGTPHAHRVPVPSPDAARSRVAASNGRRLPVATPDHRRTPDHMQHARRPPRTAPMGRASPAAVGSAPAQRPAVPDAGTSPSRGPDLGLLLACLGLVAAAAVLGLSKDGRTATRATRSRLGRVMQPLLGRR